MQKRLFNEISDQMWMFSLQHWQLWDIKRGSLQGGKKGRRRKQNLAIPTDISQAEKTKTNSIFTLPVQTMAFPVNYAAFCFLFYFYYFIYIDVGLYPIVCVVKEHLNHRGGIDWGEQWGIWWITRLQPQHPVQRIRAGTRVLKRDVQTGE